MRGTRFSRRFSARILGHLAAPVLVALTGETFAADPLPSAPLPAVAHEPTVQALDLHQCRDIALIQQPALAAARASLSVAVVKQQSLDKLRLAAIIQRDLPVRRKQAAVGVRAGEAVLSQVESEIIYGVTFSYLSTLYANEQLKIADDGLEKLTRLLDAVQEAVTSGAARREIGQTQIDLIKTELLVARAGREEAVAGLHRAASALREAMGLTAECPLVLAQCFLIDLDVSPCLHDIVELALARRGEMGQAAAGYQATCFEIEAQKSTFFFTGKTFASGSDMHVYPVPLAEHGDVYRPAGVGVEMPAILVGTRTDRVHQAAIYHDRAGAVVDKTHNLVVLDAEQTFLKWLEASKKASYLREASKLADGIADTTRKNFNPGANGKGTVEDVLTAGLRATNIRLQLNQVRYQSLLGLAGLERATAGGFCPGF